MFCGTVWHRSVQQRCLTALVFAVLTAQLSLACSHHSPEGTAQSHTAAQEAAADSGVARSGMPAAPAEPDWVQYEDYSDVEIVRTARLLLSSNQSNTTAASSSLSSVSNQPPQQQQQVDRPGPRCGVRNLTALEHSSITFKLQKARLSAARFAKPADKPGTMSIASVQQDQRSLTVSVYFHVISGTKPESTVNAPSELLAQQLSVMNSAYGPWGIRFALKGVTRVQSDTWAVTEINTDAETAMKNRLRRGGSSDLNIYFIRPTSGTLGWSTFPWEMNKLGQSFDGVVVHVGTLPGGTMAPYNKGYTLVHEVGHWLGLLHVFENGCTSPGDSVDDTPPQASAAYGCPLERHTCPGVGRDPVTNYMGYTDDACMTGFTRGQADRVLDLWGVYRGSLDNEQVVAESGVASALPPGAVQFQQQQQQQQQAKQSPPVGGGTGLGMLLPVLFRNIGLKANTATATAGSAVGVAAEVDDDSSALHGSTAPQDPAAVFAQQQAAVAAAVAAGQGGGVTGSSSTQPSVALPQFYQQQQQQQFGLGYASGVAPLQQQQQGFAQGGYYTSPIPDAMITNPVSAYVPSFTTTYRPYTASEASLPTIYGADNLAAVTAAQAAVRAASVQQQQQQPATGANLQYNSYSNPNPGGYNSYNMLAAAPGPSGAVYLQAKPARGSGSSSNDDWQATLLAAMGSQQREALPAAANFASSSSSSGSSSMQAPNSGDAQLDDGDRLNRSQPRRKMAGAASAAPAGLGLSRQQQQQQGLVDRQDVTYLKAQPSRGLGSVKSISSGRRSRPQ